MLRCACSDFGVTCTCSTCLLFLPDSLCLGLFELLGAGGVTHFCLLDFSTCLQIPTCTLLEEESTSNFCRPDSLICSVHSGSAHLQLSSRNIFWGFQVPKQGLQVPFRDGMLKHVAQDIYQLAKVCCHQVRLLKTNISGLFLIHRILCTSTTFWRVTWRSP